VRWRTAAVITLAALGATTFATTVTWIGRHAYAIYRLNRGVGDTVFLDASGRPWFRLDEARRDVPLDRIADDLIDAVIAVEDHRYYTHPGIDPIAVARAVLYNLRPTPGVQGGSTLTQQVARIMFLSNDRSYSRKAQEAVLALMFEALLSKRDILQLYLNRVYLAPGVNGVEALSRRVFGKPASDLSLGEAALVAGIIRAPATYSPWTRLPAARARSQVVLRRMREEGRITEAEEAAARRERLRVRPEPPPPTSRHAYAKEYLRQRFRDMYGGDHPPDWRVRTTFVPEIQNAAEAAVREGLRQFGVAGLQAALVALDPSTGNILAMVGGADFSTAPFNRAVRSRRQPGSAFKPFVYAAALEAGLSPVSTIEGLRSVAIDAAEGVWIPRDERVPEIDRITLRQALFESSNAAAVLLQRRIGARPVLRLADDAGLANQPDVPSLALGSGLVTPLDLTAAYSTFPGLGYRVRPRAILSVVNAAGDVVRTVDVQRDRILSSDVAYQMVAMMRDVVDRGTGAAARRAGVGGFVAGKTGTTNDYHDAWFIGFSSSVVAGVWVGFDQPRRISEGGSGSRVALPIWSTFMRRTAARLPAPPIDAPTTLTQEERCRVTFLVPVDGCPTYVEYLKEGDDAPRQLCMVHRGSIKQRAQRAIQGVLRGIGEGLKGIFGR
jgi:1A family penicillin-binding protein